MLGQRRWSPCLSVAGARYFVETQLIADRKAGSVDGHTGDRNGKEVHGIVSDCFSGLRKGESKIVNQA